MKWISSIALVIITLTQINAQDATLFANLDASPLDVVMARDDDNNAIARVIYSRPSKKDRVIFGELVPFGEVWRTGANEATEIAFYRDMIIAEQKVPAGAYSIYTIPKEDGWTFILNSQTTQWGTKYDASKNILETPMNTMPAPDTIESFSINMITTEDSMILFMGWDDTIAQIEIELSK